jgi:hypothetical protein
MTATLFDALVPCKVTKQDDDTVTVGANTMSVTEFTARMGDLGFDEASIPATLRLIRDGGCWMLQLPALQRTFLETPGNFTKFARTAKGFGN